MAHTLPDWIAALAVAATALLAPSAKADEPPAPPPQSADALLDQAEAAMDAGKLEESLVALRAALRIKPTRETACNIGFVARRLDNWLEAAEHLATCLRDAPPPGTDQERDQRAAEVMELFLASRHVGFLTFDVAPAGAEIFVDDRPVGRAPLREGVFVEPGAHVVRAEKSQKAARVTVTATEGAALPVHLRVAAQEGAAPVVSSAGAGPLAPRRPLAPAPLSSLHVFRKDVARALAITSAVGFGVAGAMQVAKLILAAQAEEHLVNKVQRDGTRCEEIDKGKGALCQQIGDKLFAAKNLDVASNGFFYGAVAFGVGALVVGVPFQGEGRVKVVGGAQGVFLTGVW
jgi:tetratricopeptide (TPR) repeat protein